MILEDCVKLAIHKQELPMVAMEILYMLSSFRRRFFLEIDQPETKIAYSGNVC